MAIMKEIGRRLKRRSSDDRQAMFYERLITGGGGEEETAEGDRVPKGYVPMNVGVDPEEAERFLVHTKLLRHPCMVELLEMAAQEFGYDQQGVLRIPCDVKHFRHVIRAIPKAAV